MNENEMIERDRQDGERAAAAIGEAFKVDDVAFAGATEAELAAKRYVVARSKQDGLPRHWRDQVEVANCMLVWRDALASDSPDALLAGVEYQIAKLDLKPGNILVVKVLRPGVNAKQMAQIQYNLQKFVGRKCLVIDGDSDLSVIEGAKVPK